MATSTVADIVRLGPVIPVLAFDTPEQGEHVSRALHAGGVKVLEITLRTAAGLEAIERAAKIAPDIVVGVGTITKPEHCALAKKAGAQFGVSPGLTRDIHQASLDAGLPLLPGVMTPSDIIAAMEFGYEIVKFFPAVPAGGINMLQAFHGPFPTLKFCPTGGITAESAINFLALPNVVCVGGSWLTPKAAVAAQDWAEVTRLAHAAGELARPVR
ncbi:bifunctional 4-hydroxy-2-oxoglutarate aldolase/2-dehydro-3-deoxy-phosphogluconate aldolase [Paraburkholderia silviterrae]|uniref:2-dehydro-3-deoxy-phosphogluconate aldolase n=1 Tax=Paraburkholderia silviterrae TaxID=2528715 RepID=A0A4V2ZYW6_9BURK|nr:bifunctional 4-hydroxy-2-oxoglutarate aldolase/2-dehydro-3-deoxy-phosphogluconate aldolase [Paraburkholderia silviterrae]TDG22393.1 bifunctional 4-hydroxy-2-oxoglutarate aldolase/2-dehydro-3-deoxy-phosphogluconate aldolase [Paraburkholderia silviterrae]